MFWPQNFSSVLLCFCISGCFRPFSTLFGYHGKKKKKKKICKEIFFLIFWLFWMFHAVLNTSPLGSKIFTHQKIFSLQPCFLFCQTCLLKHVASTLISALVWERCGRNQQKFVPDAGTSRASNGQWGSKGYWFSSVTFPLKSLAWVQWHFFWAALACDVSWEIMSVSAKVTFCGPRTSQHITEPTGAKNLFLTIFSTKMGICGQKNHCKIPRNTKKIGSTVLAWFWNPCTKSMPPCSSTKSCTSFPYKIVKCLEKRKQTFLFEFRTFS